MESGKTELIKKIIGIEDLSQSQLDRLNLQNQAYADLVTFLSNVIAKIQSGSDLRQKLETEINKLISPEEEDADRLSPNQLINLFAIMLKYDSEQSAALINTLKESIKVNINNNSSGDNNTIPIFPTTGQEEVYTKEQIQQSKKILKIAEAIESTEMSFDEIEEIIKNKKNK